MPKFIKFQEKNLKNNGDVRGHGCTKASINHEVNYWKAGGSFAYNESKEKEVRSAFSKIGSVLNMLIYLLSGLIRIKVSVLAGSMFTKICL